MACEISPGDWSDGIAIKSGISLSGDGTFELMVENSSGPIDGSPFPVTASNPLAIRFSADGTLFSYARGQWEGDCDGLLTSLTVNNSGGGIAFRGDGKLVGAGPDSTGSAIGLYIDLKDFPVVLSANDGQLVLTFRMDDSHYYETQL